MAEIATHVVGIAITKLSPLVTTEFLAFTNVKDDLESLRSTLTDVRELLGILERNRTNSSGFEQMNNWLKKLQVAAYDAGDLIASWAVEYNQWKTKKQVRKFSLPFSASKFFFQHQESCDLREITARINKILQDGQVYRTIIGVPRSESLSRQTGSLSSNIIEGRGDDVENIIKLLIPDEGASDEGSIAFIPIVGMGGLGKTTLAQLVYKNGRVHDHFKRKFWVCVTETYDKTRILRGMLESNEITFDANITFEVLQDRVRELVAEKRFLLVLDDLWNNNYMDLEPLENLLKQGVSGSKVLVTSRNNEVRKITGAKSSYSLRHFNDDESWSLFKKIAFEGRSPPDELKEYAKQIVNKCNGLPLAVKQMGGLLRGITDEEEWRYIAKSEIWELEKDKVLPALRLSYNHLSSALKQCFAYCSLFPKAYVFEKNELVKLWMAEAFIQPHDRHRTEDIGSRYFKELSDRFFFEISAEDKSKCRMHDLIHDLALLISSPFFCQVKDTVPKSLDEVSRHVSLLSNEVEQPLSEIIKKSKKLRTLLLPVKHFKAFGKAQRAIFHSLKYMRTLDLSSSTLHELSGSIENLKLLHYLDLSKTEIKKLPDSICNLYHLETLKLSDCPWLFTLPGKLNTLVNLRHLELDEMFWYKVSTLPKSMGCLTSLHNLHKFQVGCNTGYKLQELKNMEYLTGFLHISNLENAVDAGEANLKEKEMIDKVVYEWSSSNLNLQDEDAKQVLQDLQPHPRVQEIQICHYRSCEFPIWIRYGKYENLTSIYLNHCTRIKILSLGELPNLRELRLKNMAEMMEWKEENDVFLLSLKISGCPKLTKLPGYFPVLHSMKIKNCESLDTLPVGPVEFIRLAGNPVLKHWTEVNVLTRRVVDGRLVTSHGMTSHYLLEANIINCPELQRLPRELHPQKLEISGCKNLRTLPDADHAGWLGVLALDACHDETLVGMIPSSGSLYSLVISNIPNLICLPKWPSLPSLQALYIRDCADLEYLFNQENGNGLFDGYNSLKHLSIRNCPKLLTLPAEGLPASLQVLSIGQCESLSSFGPREVLAKLTSLGDLYLEDCPALQSLPEEGLSASLQHLSIQGCPSLIRSCAKDGSDWPKIKDIPDLEIEMTSTETRRSSSSAPWYNPSRNRGGNKSKGKKASA
ncbi:putative disease resistance protein RGA3 [Rosa sericea]